jgi:hypothetical protein
MVNKFWSFATSTYVPWGQGLPAPCIVTSDWLVEGGWTHLRAGYINMAHPVANITTERSLD